MKQKIKSAVFYAPKIFIFCFALYNFASLWFEAEISKGIGALVSPWYEPWNYYNEPSLLFYAAILLFLGKRQSNLSAAILSGFIFGKGIYLITRFGWMKWFEWLPKQWNFIRENDFDILKEWEIQIIFALIIFCFSIFYSVREKPRKDFLLS